MTALDWSNSRGATAAAAPSRRALRLPSRSTRVVALVIAIAAVSLADLYLTLLYLSNGGMGESNPIARWVMGMNLPWLLAGWKVLLAGGACLIFLGTRRRWSAEVGAWVGAAVMLWLCGRWTTYIDETHRSASSIPALASEYRSPQWVQFIEN